MNSVVHYIEAIFLRLLTQYLTSVRPLPCSVRLTPDISPDLPSDEPSKSNGRDRMRFEANSGTLYIYIYMHAPLKREGGCRAGLVASDKQELYGSRV